MKDIKVNIDPKLSRKEFYAELLEQIASICEDQTFWVRSTIFLFIIFFHSLFFLLGD